MTVDVAKTAEEILALLRRHYLPDNRPAPGLFAPEIESPCGGRRADLIWMPTISRLSGELHGHEIKVTRADLQSELADPTKADPWGRYCQFWWLVVPSQGMLSGLDVPETWGIMAPPSGRLRRSMTVVRPAPRLTPAAQAPAFQRLAAWQMHAAASRTDRLTRQVTYLTRENERLQRDLQAAQVNGAGWRSPHAQRIAKIVQAVEQRAAAEPGYLTIRDEDIVEAIIDAARVRDAHRQLTFALKRAARDAQNTIDAYTRAAEQVAALQVPAPVEQVTG